MNTRSIRLVQRLAILAVTFAPLLLPAAPFVQGSAINIAAGSPVFLDMPPDGVFNCTTIFVACNGELRFNRNSLNTPVFLVAIGDVRIEGKIIVDGDAANNSQGGFGGPGGFSGGMGGILGGHEIPGSGAGPGGGRNLAGWFGGAFGLPARSNTNTYGNALLLPVIGGSGGSGKHAAAGGYGGGGGGGAIVIASQSRISFAVPCYPNDGGVYALGGDGAGTYGGGGSGGAIRLIAPIIGGNGYLDTSGGNGGWAGCCGDYADSGSRGRIRIDCLDDYAFRSLTIKGSFSRGTQIFVFRTNAPRLDILEVADSVGTNRTVIPLGTTSTISVSLPFGAPTNQVVKLRAENFTNAVPVRISVTPDTGPALTFDGVIPNSGSPATNSFNVVIPAGTISRIDAWTR